MVHVIALLPREELWGPVECIPMTELGYKHRPSNRFFNKNKLRQYFRRSHLYIFACFFFNFSLVFFFFCLFLLFFLFVSTHSHLVLFPLPAAVLRKTKREFVRFFFCFFLYTRRRSKICAWYDHYLLFIGNEVYLVCLLYTDRARNVIGNNIENIYLYYAHIFFSFLEQWLRDDI